MGTTYSINIIDRLSQFSKSELSQGVKLTLDKLDALMSNWRPDSKLSRLNQASVGKWMPLSADTIHVLDLALRIAQETQGSYDITVAPLVKLWGFGPRDFRTEKTLYAVPVDAAIEAAKLKVGYQQIDMDKNRNRVSKQAERMIDLSSIAKGYAVDKVAAYLDRYGINHYMVEIGGEIRAKGNKIDGTHWIIAIEAPLVDQRKAYASFSLMDEAVATSGDYRHFFEHDERRFSHTIDPITGRPVNHALTSVTVVASTTASADAYATALMVMGPEKGRQFAEKMDIAAYFILKNKRGYRAQQTSKFAALLVKKSSY